MSALTKAMIVDHIQYQVGLKKPDAKAFLDLFLETICSKLESGEHVKLSGFGNFILRDKSKRPGRNPKTGEEIPVLPRRVVTFRPGYKLKNKVSQNTL